MMEGYNKISSNCRKATFLIDKKNLEGIRFIQHVELHVHLASCFICRLYLKKSKAIDKLVDDFYHTNTKPEFALDEGFKDFLERTISKELKNKLFF